VIHRAHTLNLSDSQVSDDGLIHLQPLNNLTSLVLYRTAVSDTGLTHLAGLKNLRILNVASTNVTVAEVVKLRQLLPQCNIVAPDARK
jgi:internalin A